MSHTSEYRAMGGGERVLCSTLCLCLALGVMSTVSIIYLTVIIYLPAQKELESGFSDTSVMCTTIETRRIKGNIDECRWSSCTEWCLSRGGGDCTHIYVSVRYNGTDLALNDCTAVFEKNCPHLDLEKAERRNCKEDHQCTRLNKMFKCQDGDCVNITSVYRCSYDQEDTDPPVNCVKKRNCVELEGMFDCHDGRCKRINEWSCERRCADFPTRGKNVALVAGDHIIFAHCKTAREIEGEQEIVWREEDYRGKILMASCTTLSIEGNVIQGMDCINGSVIPSHYLDDSTNYTQLMRVARVFGPPHRLDPNAAIVPFDKDVTIFNQTRLMINTDGCVNTLKYECNGFYKNFSKDGRNASAPARFPCYYAPHNPDFVVQRFNPKHTKWSFLMFFLIPVGLMIFSCGTLFLCSRVVRIDNHGHMVISLHRPEDQASAKGFPEKIKVEIDDDDDDDCED